MGVLEYSLHVLGTLVISMLGRSTQRSMTSFYINYHFDLILSSKV